MEPITHFDIYDFYQKNRRPNMTQSEFVRSFLKHMFDIPFDELEETALKSCEAEIKVLVSRLKKVLAASKEKKNIESLKQCEFMDLRSFPALLDLSKQNALPGVSYSESKEQQTYNQSDFDYGTSLNIPLESPALTAKPRKCFSDLRTRKQRHARIEESIAVLEDIAKNENLSLASLLGYIGYSHYYNDNKKLARLFQSIYHESDPDSSKEIPIETAIYLKENSMISKRHYTDLRLTLKHIAVFPTYNKVASYIQNTMPILRPINDGMIAKVLDVALKTLTRLPDNAIGFLMDVQEQRRNPRFVANFTTGLDGSGSHSVYNAPSFLNSTKKTSNYIIAGMSLNSICIDDGSNTTVYSVDNACSFKNQRPIAILPGRETRDNIQDVVAALDIGMFQGKNIDHIIDFGKFTATFRLNITMSQVDTKMIKMITGLTGAYCTSCTSSEADAHKLSNISQGFKINRSIENMKNLYEEISLLDEDGVEFIPKSRKDYEKRKGMCVKPITKADVCSNITVLHSYLNSLSFFERIFYCLNSGVLKMTSKFKNVRYSKEETKRISEAKKRLQLKARSAPLFTQLDTPSSGGTAGTSDSGNVARMFFSYEKRNEVCALLEENANISNDHRSMIKDLIQRFSIILRVLSSKSVLVDYSKFGKYCNETYYQLVSNFNWIHVPGSIHRLLSHCAERIHMNSDYGLGNLSEEGLESCNKMIRKFRVLGSRNMGLKETIRDMFTHWWIQTDGRIQACARTNQCNNCWRVGTRSHLGSARITHTNDMPRIDFIGNDDAWIFENLLLMT